MAGCHVIISKELILQEPSSEDRIEQHGKSPSNPGHQRINPAGEV